MLRKMLLIVLIGSLVGGYVLAQDTEEEQGKGKGKPEVTKEEKPEKAERTLDEMHQQMNQAREQHIKVSSDVRSVKKLLKTKLPKSNWLKAKHLFM